MFDLLSQRGVRGELLHYTYHGCAYMWNVRCTFQGVHGVWCADLRGKMFKRLEQFNVI
jgi:hypothetical protein